MNRFAFLTIAFLALGCGVKAHDVVRPEPFVPVELTRLTPELGSQSGGGSRMRLVIGDAEAFRFYWSRAFPDRPLPEVDFRREVVLLASMDSQPTGGYRIAIDRVGVQGQVMIAEVRSTLPGAHCVVSMAPTAPVEMVKVPFRSLPIRFLEISDVFACGGMELPGLR